MNILSGQELLKALSDLPIALLSIPAIGILARISSEKKKEKYLWILTFAGLMTAAVLGTIAHGVSMADGSLRILWVFLYFFMFLITFLFSRLVRAICMGDMGTPKEQGIFGAMAVLLYILAAGIRLATGKNMIGVFALYGLLTAGAALIYIRKRNRTRASDLMPVVFGFLLAGLLFQGAALMIPSFNGAFFAHLAILAAVAVLIRAVRLDLSDINVKKTQKYI